MFSCAKLFTEQMIRKIFMNMIFFKKICILKDVFHNIICMFYDSKKTTIPMLTDIKHKTKDTYLLLNSSSGTYILVK